MKTKAFEQRQSGFALDTTFVLFFLALEFGRTMQFFTPDGILMLATMLMVAVLPYYLPMNNEKPAFRGWLFGRGLIAVFGVFLGVAFSQTLGTIFPETLRFMPMTLLIAASMISCYTQFYGLMRLRLAK